MAIDAKRAGDALGGVHLWRAQGHRPRRRRLCPGRVARGAGEILLTSMDQDGAKTGYDIALLKAVTVGGRRAGDRQRRGRATPST